MGSQCSDWVGWWNNWFPSFRKNDLYSSVFPGYMSFGSRMLPEVLCRLCCCSLQSKGSGSSSSTVVVVAVVVVIIIIMMMTIIMQTFIQDIFHTHKYVYTTLADSSSLMLLNTEPPHPQSSWLMNRILKIRKLAKKTKTKVYETLVQPKFLEQCKSSIRKELGLLQQKSVGYRWLQRF